MQFSSDNDQEVVMLDGVPLIEASMDWGDSPFHDDNWSAKRQKDTLRLMDPDTEGYVILRITRRQVGGEDVGIEVDSCIPEGVKQALKETCERIAREL